MKKLTIAQRKQFVSIIFDALAATEAKTLSEISPKSIVGIIDSVKNIDPESKKLLSDMLKLVLKTVRENR
jgi:aspartate carbamoyltransferase regulatory subunit